MPQLDEIDIFSRDHMTVDKFDPQGNLIDRKIIFSRSVEDTPIFDSDMELFERAMQAQGSQDPAEIAAKIRSRIDSGEYKMNLRPEDQYVRMIDPATGAFVEVENNLPTIQSYIDAGYRFGSAKGGKISPKSRKGKRRSLLDKIPSNIGGGFVSDREMERFVRRNKYKFSEGGSVEDEDIFGYSLGGSVSEMMGRTGPDLTAAQIANLAGAFADPYGGADLTGNYPEFPARGVSVEEMLRGPRAPSFLQNLREGNFGSAALQGIGAIPVLGGMSKVIRGASRAGRTPPDPRMLRAAEQGFDTSTVYYHGAESDIEEFLLPSKERGQTRTADTGIFFTKSPAIASTYSLYPGVKKAEELGRAGSVYPVYLNKKDFIKITSKDFKTGEVAPRMWSRLDLDEMYVTLPDGKEQSIYDYLGLDLETAPPGLLTTDKISKMVRDKTDAKGIIFENVYDTGSGLFDLRKAEFGYENYYDRKGILEPNFEPPKQRFDLSAEAEKPSEIVVAFDPKNIRSVNAQFADKPDTELPPLSRSEGGEVDIFDVDSYSLGGSVGDMIREQAGISREDVLTPAQLANIAGGFVDPYGSADIAGLYPEFPDRDVTIEQMADPNYPRSPSAAENLAQGDYLNLLFQSFGALPFVGGAIKGIRALGKMPPSIVDPLSTDASGLLTGRTGFGPEAELAQAKDTPPQLARIIDDESVLQKQYAKDLTVPELSKLANKKSAASFLNFMDTFPAAREMATVAQAGLAKKGWYRQSAQALYDVFGDEAPRFAALLAATSPQTSVQGNLLNATSIWRNLTQNNMPRDPVLFDIINEPGVAAALKLKKNVPLKNADGSPQLNKAGNQKYGLRNISEQEAREVIKKAGGGDSTFDVGRMQIEIMGDAVQGEKGAESVLDAWVSNSIRAINVPDNEMDKLVLSGPKVDSFMRNLVNNTVEVTNDTWMANYLGVEQNVFGGSLNPARIDPGKGPGYLAANALTRNASRILSDRIGENVTPEMIQEMVWSWSKAVFEQSRAVGMSPREFIQKGRLTDAMINDVPDFSSLLRDPDLPYRGILKASGATVGQFKKGEIPKGNRTEEIMKSSDTARRNLERAANRLKFIKADQLALGAIVPLVAINIVNMGKVPDEEEGSSEVDNIDIFN